MARSICRIERGRRRRSGWETTNSKWRLLRYDARNKRTWRGFLTLGAFHQSARQLATVFMSVCAGPTCIASIVTTDGGGGYFFDYLFGAELGGAGPAKENLLLTRLVKAPW